MDVMDISCKDALVDCVNAKLLEDVYATIKETASEVFNETASPANDEERRKLAMERFELVFRELMNDNLRFVNDDCNTDDPIKNDARLVYYCTEVLPKVDSILVDVAKKRKTYPKKCRQRLQTKLDSEVAQYETNVSDEPNECKRLKQEKDSIDPMDEELIGLATTVATNLSTIKQTSHELTTKVNSLRIARTQFDQNGDTDRKFDISDFAMDVND